MKGYLVYFIVLLGMLLVVLSVWLVYVEIKEAKEYCDSIKGEYKFRGIHLCNDEPIYQYSFNGKRFWSFKLPDLNNLTVNWSSLE
jgi:hypothetical protein